MRTLTRAAPNASFVERRYVFDMYLVDYIECIVISASEEEIIGRITLSPHFKMETKCSLSLIRFFWV